MADWHVSSSTQHVSILKASDIQKIPRFAGHAGATLQFSFSVVWTPSNLRFSERFDRYLDESFFEHQVHWFALINSFMMVLFLTALVALILMRTLRNDYARCAAGGSGVWP